MLNGFKAVVTAQSAKAVRREPEAGVEASCTEPATALAISETHSVALATTAIPAVSPTVACCTVLSVPKSADTYGCFQHAPTVEKAVHAV